ncbi:MAG TPA: glycosyltransferase family 2 protein [Nitrospirota bacterium]|nr:glycosyltransferase family 2 protein [Nitrospirota bacterium]
MKLSIITISYNSVKTLESTIQSVISQNCPGLEYLIVDGGSTDGTVDIIRKYHASGHVTRYISEKDAGISDAFNKGIAMSTGDIIGMINSDDHYVPGVLEKVCKLYEENGTNFVLYGNMLRQSEDKTVRIRPRPLQRLWIYVDCPYDHPTVFVPKAVYDRIKPYNTNYRYSMDYDFYVRAMKAGIQFRYLNEDIALFSTGGISSQSARECHREVLRIQKENGMFLPLSYLTYAMKMLVNLLKRALRWTTVFTS